jgi:hypothetical protein
VRVWRGPYCEGFYQRRAFFGPSRSPWDGLIENAMAGILQEALAYQESRGVMTFVASISMWDKTHIGNANWRARERDIQNGQTDGSKGGKSISRSWRNRVQT